MAWLLHNRWKAATLVVSAISLVVILLQAFYSQHWNKIEFVSAEIERKKKELSELSAIPLVTISVTTLEKARLTKHIIDNIDAIPATLELKHGGGDTAKGIRLKIESSEPISKFQKWSSLELFEVSQDPAQGNTLYLEAPQLRRGSSLGVTIITENISTIDYEAVIDIGEVSTIPSATSLVEALLKTTSDSFSSNMIRYDSVYSKKNFVAKKFDGLSSTFDDIGQNDRVLSRYVLDTQIALRQQELERLQKLSFFGWLINNLSAYLGLIPISVILAISSVLAFMAVPAIGWLRRREH